MARQSDFLDGKLRARNYFVAIQDDILESLAQGKLSLPQACERLYYSAHEFYPRFLKFLGAPVNSTLNLTLKELLARNLVSHFRAEARDDPKFMEVAKRLARELAGPPFRDWCRQPWENQDY